MITHTYVIHKSTGSRCNLAFFKHSLHSLTDSKCLQKLSQLFFVLFNLDIILLSAHSSFLYNYHKYYVFYHEYISFSHQSIVIFSFTRKLFYFLDHFAHVPISQTRPHNNESLTIILSLSIKSFSCITQKLFFFLGHTQNYHGRAENGN